MQFLIIFLPFLWLLGNLVGRRYHINWHHHILIGFIVYFIIFNITSIPFTILGLSWKIYYYSQFLLHALGIFIVLYLYFYKLRYYQQWTMNKFKDYCKTYWPVYVVLVVYIIFSWFNTSTIFWNNHTGAVWDDYFYSAKALKSIDVTHLYQQHFVYINKVVPIQEKLVVWELFWSFMGTIFKIHTMTLAHKYIPILVLTLFIMSYDELLCLLDNKKQHKYYILGLLIFVIFGYIQSELVKTLYMTWYGNVVVATTFFPLLLITLIKSLKYKKYLIILLLLPLAFIGFSNGIVVFAGITYLIAGIVWLVYKKYQLRGAMLGYSLLACLIFIILFLFSYMITRQFTMFNHITEAPALETEKNIFTYFFNIRLPLILLSIFYFTVQLFNKKLSENHIIIIGISLLILSLGLLPIINNILYNTLNFSFRRLLESVSILIVIYIWVILLNQTYQRIKWQYLIITIMIFVYIYAKTTRIYVLEFRHIFSSAAIVQPYKVHPIVTELSDQFNNLSPDKTITVAFRSELSDKGQHFSRIFPTKGATQERQLHYNFGDALVGMNKNLYLYQFENNKVSISQMQKDKVDYLVTDNHFLTQMICQYYQGQIVGQLTDDTLNSPIYIIKMSY